MLYIADGTVILKTILDGETAASDPDLPEYRFRFSSIFRCVKRKDSNFH